MRARSRAPPGCAAAPEPIARQRGPTGGLTIADTPTRGPDAVAFEIERLEVVRGQIEVHGRWYGVGGHRFVRPALILVDAEGAERRLLAELDDKPWAAEDGESWRAAFAVDSARELDDASRLELSVAPNINVELRSGGVNAEGLIAASGRVAAEAPTTKGGHAAQNAPIAAAGDPAPEPDLDDAPDLPFPLPPRHRRARGAPAVPEPGTPGLPSASFTPRPRPAANRAADVERLTARLQATEETLEREQRRREEVEQKLEHERGEARRTLAELARTQAELELARTAEAEAADTAAELDAARRRNHELRARHEALQADHHRTLQARSELERALEQRSAELKSARQELSDERRQRRQADTRASAAVPAGAESGHRPPTVHAGGHIPPPPRTDRPVNPSLRQSPWLRLLVVLVIAGVVLAVYLVLHSTVLH